MLKKINTYILYLLIFTLPFNIRYIFNFSKISHIKTFREHLVVSFQLFDFLFLCFFLLFVWEYRQKIFNKNFFIYIIKKQPLFYFISFVFFSLALNFNTPFNTTHTGQNSFILSIESPLFWYKIIKFAEILLFFILSRHFLKQFTVSIYAKFILFTSGVIQGIIAIIQFATQKSIGLNFLGESVLDVKMTGVAKFFFNGETLLRAYGTFPHPNILGIFLVFTLASGLSLLNFKKRLFFGLALKYKLLLFLEFLIIYLGILFTYSRTNIALTIIITSIFIYQKRHLINRQFQKLCSFLKIPFFLRTTLAIILFFGFSFLLYNIIAPRFCLQCPNDKSIYFRKIYRQEALFMIINHPFIGIGLNNFIPTLQHSPTNHLHPWRIQPVHNLYLLIASETGLIGLILFLVSIFHYFSPNFKLSSLKNSFLNIFFLLILLIAFFDHYFWTIHQGRLIFWLALAFASVPNSIKNDSPRYHSKTVLLKVRKFIQIIST